MITVLLLIAGILLLLFGGDFLVKGASGIALKFDMPPMLVGMTVVAFGTSAPELVVSVQAALAGKSDIAIGNVVGSNIANVALILGLTVIIFPMTVKRDSLRIDWVAMMLASILVYLFALNYEISQIEGIIMILALIGFIVFSFLRSNRKKLTALPPDVPINAKSQPVWMLILFVVLGCVALVFGADGFFQVPKMLRALSVCRTG
jgi:cation:H+ antiporter